MNPTITMLGTGSAFPTRSYNSCFLLRDNGLMLLVDAGGGNGILARLREAGTDASALRHFFVSHAHTDHILGAVWILRAAAQRMREGGETERLHLYGNSDVVEALRTICRLTLHTADYKRVEEATDFHTVADGDCIDIDGHRTEFFDVRSMNVRQTGFRLQLDNGLTLAATGDEALTAHNAEAVRGADWLVCGAFCRYADRDIYQPYEKHHYTVADVARTAQETGIPNLVLVHCEDRSLPRREELYRSEAAGLYGGNLIVPEDGRVIDLSAYV